VSNEKLALHIAILGVLIAAIPLGIVAVAIIAVFLLGLLSAELLRRKEPDRELENGNKQPQHPKPDASTELSRAEKAPAETVAASKAESPQPTGTSKSEAGTARL
jgi:hypothetical protein